MKQGRVYPIPFGAVAVTAQQDLWGVAPIANKAVELVGLQLSQSSDAGDAQDEMLRIAVIRGHTTVGSGGSSVTPGPAKINDAAAGFTARVNDTTIASGGTAVTLMEDCFNVRAGYINWFPEGCEPSVDASTANNRLVVRLLTTPGDSLTMSGTAWVRELN